MSLKEEWNVRKRLEVSTLVRTNLATGPSIRNENSFQLPFMRAVYVMFVSLYTYTRVHSLDDILLCVCFDISREYRSVYDIR